MKVNKHLKEWMKIVSSRFPNLSLPQLSGLSTWSFGMVMTKSSSLTKVSSFIAKLNNEKYYTVRQRLKEWYQEASAKSGKKRANIVVKDCFYYLLKWVIDLLGNSCKELPLAMDATTLKQNFTVLSIHVLYHGCAIPIAWKIVKATEAGSWRPHWEELFNSIKNVVPPDWNVIVCADRGLYADWLFDVITQLGWHPFLRINHQGKFRERNSKNWQLLSQLLPSPQSRWSGKVTCFKSNPIECTLLAWWDENYQDPWLIVTDLDPESADIRWYGFRCWIECSYRDIKSDGWDWNRTRITSPQRAERQWLAMAVALLWTITLDEPLVSDEEPNSDEKIVSTHTSNSSQSHNTPQRKLSCFINGLLNLLAQLLNGLPLTIGTLEPLPFNDFSLSFYPDSS